MTYYTKNKTRALVYTSLFTVLTAICSWISLPAGIPFTLQTFAIFCAVFILGAKKALFSVILYIALAAAGIPVLSGFRAGIGAILDLTGGFVIGFIFIPLSCLIAGSLSKQSKILTIPSCIFGLSLCYAFGTFWYTKSISFSNLLPVLTLCVFPYIIPDIIKMILAYTFSKALAQYIRI